MGDSSSMSPATTPPTSSRSSGSSTSSSSRPSRTGQRPSRRCPFLGAYVTLHLGATAAALVWLYRSHPARFPLVRNTLVVATALSLVGYVLYPAAPPRLSGHGFVDTVSWHTHVNLSSDLLGSLYNPFAAVPSIHFGYSLIVGAALRGRTAPGRARRRRSLPAVHALRHRRDREPLPVRRGEGGLVVSPPGSSPGRSSPLRGVRVAAPRDARQRDVRSRRSFRAA